MLKKLPLLLLIFLTQSIFGQINYNFKWETAWGPDGGPEPAGLDTIIFPHGVQDRLARLTIGDLDGDGDSDFIAGNQEGELFYYKNSGTPTNPHWGRSPLNTLDTIDLGINQNINQTFPELIDIDNKRMMI